MAGRVEPCPNPKYSGLLGSSLPHRLRAEPPPRGGQEAKNPHSKEPTLALLKLDKERRPRVLLVPPPDLPVPAVQGGAVETLLTHLIRENEKQGQLDLLCASVTDDAARRAAEAASAPRRPDLSRAARAPEENDGEKKEADHDNG